MLTRSKPPVCSRKCSSSSARPVGWYFRKYAARRVESPLLKASSHWRSAVPAGVAGMLGDAERFSEACASTRQAPATMARQSADSTTGFFIWTPPLLEDANCLTSQAFVLPNGEQARQ